MRMKIRRAFWFVSYKLNYIIYDFQYSVHPVAVLLLL